MKRHRFPICLLLAELASVGICYGAENGAATVDFSREIRPILSDVCYKCHGPDSASRDSELRLDKREGIFAELDGGRPVVPGKPEESELVRRITTTDADERMPPPDSGRQLTPEQIALVRRWVEQGATWQDHWSLVAPERPPLPVVKNTAWTKNPIDYFVLARLEQEGLQPSAEAARETLIRRATLDLTGLPPTLEEVDAFVADESPDAYEKVVDRLLASPRYGEHMVLSWLDAARYSDTNGYQTDGTRAMWPWRDWVIESLNANMPFDQFTIQQIAGDMLPDATMNQKIATGFNRNHMLNGEGGRIAEESRVEYVVDRLETTGTLWLGLTIGCGRCHEHKYDPISQREFYGLYAYFNNVDETGAVDRRSSTAAPTIELPTAEQQKRQAELKETIAALDKQIHSAESGSAERKALEKQRDEAKRALNDLNKSVLITMVMQERPEQRETFVLTRGQYDKHGEKVAPGIPACFPPLPAGAPNNRLGFARWLVDRSNPLTARVTVNRYWQTFFGTGLVKTTEDFGAQGELPTHPALLDWLATEFMGAWDVKALHRLIVTSATYRQSSQTNATLEDRDPENRLLARGPRYRLSSFAIRDQALALSGLLVEKLGGPPVQPYQPPGIWAEFSFGKIVYKQDHGENLYRRSLYTFWRRSVGPTTMFDTSARQVCTVRERRTNTPLHSLILLNDEAYVEAARALGERMMREGGATAAERIAYGFRLATARRPSDLERQILTERFEKVRSQYAKDQDAALKLVTVGESSRDESLDVAELAAYTGIASVIMNLDEVLNKE